MVVLARHAAAQPRIRPRAIPKLPAPVVAPIMIAPAPVRPHPVRPEPPDASNAAARRSRALLSGPDGRELITNAPEIRPRHVQNLVPALPHPMEMGLSPRIPLRFITITHAHIIPALSLAIPGFIHLAGTAYLIPIRA